ncbi:MAG: cyclic nucleotide-binding domain-containing protein, partial [Candidatus Omnitrophica bacterium]|nr:cyclic nucleotide-binding domain-containing protein [Candidatus Omnitrophota bacterium]
MSFLDSDLILKEIPLFSGLSVRQREIIKRRSNIVEYKKGDIIYQEGSQASGLYCVVLGRVVIFTQDQSGNRMVLEYLHRGKYFGIISLLTNEPHSVSAQAINDSMLLVIDRKDFDFILKKIPTLAIDLSRTLSRRLKRKDVHQKTIFESTVISVFSSSSRSGKTIYALNLALSLKKETHKSVVVLDILPVGNTHTLPQRLEIGNYRIFDLSSGASTENVSCAKDFILKSNFDVDLICFYYRPDEQRCMKMLVAVLTLLVNDYHYLILDMPSAMDNSVCDILNQSDLVHILSSPERGDLLRTRDLIHNLKTTFNFPEEKIKIIINEYKFARLSYAEQVSILQRPVSATLPKIEDTSTDRILLDNPQAEYTKAIRRISRELSGSMVGLVLGVGVAYG